MFDALIESSQVFRHLVFKRVSQHLNGVVAHALILARGNVTERLATFILHLSNSQRCRGYSPCHFRFSMSRHDIANCLGMAAETVSRALAGFHEQGLLSVSRRGKLQIPDFQGLARAGGPRTLELAQARECA